ncbi:MAG: hypothetical protein ACRD04_01075 [Terriglobales bacterium]
MASRHEVSVFSGREGATEGSAAEAAAAGEAAPSGVASSRGGGVAPDPEADAKPKRRTFAAAYRRWFPKQADAANGRGKSGAPRRREGRYSSALTGWHRERAAATEEAFSRPRGPKPRRTAEEAEIEKPRRRKQRLEEDLRKAEVVIEVQKKVARRLRQPASETPGQKPMIQAAIDERTARARRRQACHALAVPRATWCRRWRPPQPRRRPGVSNIRAAQRRQIKTGWREQYQFGP